MTHRIPPKRTGESTTVRSLVIHEFYVQGNISLRSISQTIDLDEEDRTKGGDKGRRAGVVGMWRYEAWAVFPLRFSGHHSLLVIRKTGEKDTRETSLTTQNIFEFF